MELITIEEALALEPERSHRHVLLGNGFSIASKPDIFTYGALFDRADFSDLSSQAREAFDVLDTRDFEIVMRALRNASKLVRLYSSRDRQLATRLERDADSLREVLVNAIAQSHPEMPSDIPDESYAACRIFLGNYIRV